MPARRLEKFLKKFFRFTKKTAKCLYKGMNFLLWKMGKNGIIEKKGGEKMSGSPIIKKALKEKKIRQKDLADFLGIELQTIHNRLYRDVFPFNDVEKILNWAGYEIIIIDKETKKPLL